MGEAFAANVINAVMHGPGWAKTLLIWCTTSTVATTTTCRHPGRLRPTTKRPGIIAPTDQPGGYDRYGIPGPGRACLAVRTAD